MSNPFEKYFQATERQNDKINRMTPNWEVPASSPFVPFDTSLDARYSELNKPYTPDPTLKSAGDLLVDAAASALKIPTIVGGVAVGAADLALSAASKPFEWAMDAGHAVRPDLIPKPMEVGIGYIAKGLHDTIGYRPEEAKAFIDEKLFSDARKIQEKEYHSGYTAAEDKAFQDSWTKDYQTQYLNLQQAGATEQQLKDFSAGFDKQYQEAATKRADKYQTSWDKPLSENINIIGHGFDNLLENPSLALGGAIESAGYLLPSMAVSRGVMALEKAAKVAKLGAGGVGAIQPLHRFAAAGVGEGSVSGLTVLEQMRSQMPDGIAGGRELLGAAAVAASTGLLGAGFGKAASKLGIDDVDSVGLGRAASQVAAMKLPALVRPVGAVAQEGAEEFAQTFGESIIPNVTMGKDPLEGLGQELPLGTLAGAIMGAGMNAPSLVSGGFSDISSGLGKVKEAASLKSFDTLSNPEHKNYNPAQAFNIQLKNLESNDETVRTQAEASVSKIETDLDTARASVEERIKSIQATLKAMPPSDQTTDAQKLEIEALGKEYSELTTKSSTLADQYVAFIEAQVTAQEHRDVQQGTQFTEEQAKADIATLTQPSTAPKSGVWTVDDMTIEMDILSEPDAIGNVLARRTGAAEDTALEIEIPISEVTLNPDTNPVAQQEALDRVTRHFSKYSNDDLDLLASSPVLTESQRNSLRVLSKSKRELAAVQDPSQVFDNILNGYKGKTIQESHRGLNQYTDMVNTAVATKNGQLASLALDGLGAFTDDHTAKRDTINEAFGLVQKGTYKEVQVVRTQDGTWGMVPFTAQEVRAGKNADGVVFLEGKALKDAMNKVGGFNVHINSDKNGAITQINNETQLIQDRFNALSGVAESFVGVTPKPVDTSIAPTVDTPIVTEPSDTTPPVVSPTPEAPVQSVAPTQQDTPEDIEDTGKDNTEVGFKLTPTGQYTSKDQLKADKATKFIGEGAANSSTAQYAKDAGDKANTGKYTKNDVVFISVNGARANRQAPNLVEIQKAIDAGATILTDKLSDRERSFNVGEREVAAHLTKNGYVEEGNTGVWKPKAKTADTTPPVSGKAKDVVAELKQSHSGLLSAETKATLDTLLDLSINLFPDTLVQFIKDVSQIPARLKVTKFTFGKTVFDPDNARQANVFINPESKVGKDGNVVSDLYETIVHEFIHAATVGYLNSNFEGTQYKTLLSLVDAVNEYLDSQPNESQDSIVQALRNIVRHENPVAQVQELLAYGLTHSVVSEWAKVTPYAWSTETNKGISDASQVLLDGNTPKTVYDALLAVYGNIIQIEERNNALLQAKRTPNDNGTTEGGVGGASDTNDTSIKEQSAKSDGGTGTGNVEVKQTSTESQEVIPLKSDFKGKVILAHAGTGKSFATKSNPDLIDGDVLYYQATNTIVDKYNEANNESVPNIENVTGTRGVFEAWGEYGDKAATKALASIKAVYGFEDIESLADVTSKEVKQWKAVTNDKKLNRPQSDIDAINGYIAEIESYLSNKTEIDSRKAEAIRRRNEIYQEYADQAKALAKAGKTVLSSSIRGELIAVADMVVIQDDAAFIGKNLTSAERVNQNSETDLVKIREKIQKAVKVAGKLNEEGVPIVAYKLGKGEYISDLIFENEAVAPKDAKVTVLQGVTDEIREEERNKPFSIRKMIRAYFTQDTTEDEQKGNNPLVLIKDFILQSDLLTNVSKYLSEKTKSRVTDAHIAQLKDFQEFHAKFSKVVMRVLHDDRSKVSKDNFVRELLNQENPEDLGTLDENVLTAISLAAYGYLIRFGNTVYNTDDVIRSIVRLKKDQELPSEVAQILRYAGHEAPIVEQQLGEQISKSLALKAMKDSSATLQNRLDVSFGNLVTAALHDVGYIELDDTSISPKVVGELLRHAGYAGDEDSGTQEESDGLVAQHALEKLSKLTFIRPNYYKDPKGQGLKLQTPDMIERKSKNTYSLLAPERDPATGDFYIKKLVWGTDLKQTSSTDIMNIIGLAKPTAGFLSKLMGVDVGFTVPTTTEPESIEGNTKQGTNNTVPKQQQKLVKEGQVKAKFSIRANTVNALNALKSLSEDSKLLKQLLGVWYDDDVKARTHIRDRDSVEAKNKSEWDILERGLDWAGQISLGNDEYLDFYDTQYVSQNERMQYLSNFFNMQSSQLHRAMASLSEFKLDISLEDLTLSNENLTRFYQAVGEGLEGLDDVLQASIKKRAGLQQFFTVDKVSADNYVEALQEYLKSDESVKAIAAMETVLRGNKPSTKEQSAIATFVKHGDMGVQSLQSLIALAEMQMAVLDGKPFFTTTVGLGSDGVNNGVASANILTGVISRDMKQQVGMLAKGQVKTMQEAFLRGLPDYYISFGIAMGKALKAVRERKSTTVNNTKWHDALQELFPVYKAIEIASLEMRKVAKTWSIPFNYGAGKKSLQRALGRGFLDGIYGEMTDISNKALEAKVAFKEGTITKEAYTLIQEDLKLKANTLELHVNTILQRARIMKNSKGQVISVNGKNQYLPRYSIKFPTDLTHLNEYTFGNALEQNGYDYFSMNRDTTQLVEQLLLDAVNAIHGAAAWEATQEYAEKYTKVRDTLNTSNTAAFMLYDGMRTKLIQAKLNQKEEALLGVIRAWNAQVTTNNDELVASLGAIKARKSPQWRTDGVSIAELKQEHEYLGLTTEEMREIDDILAPINPTLHSALSQETGDLKSGIALATQETAIQKAEPSKQVETKYPNKYIRTEKGFASMRPVLRGLKDKLEVTSGIKSLAMAIQGIDAYVAAYLQAKFPTLNVHDAGIFGLKYFREATKYQNEIYLQAMTTYHLNVEHAEALVRSYLGLKDFIASLDSLNLSPEAKELFIKEAEYAKDDVLNGVAERNADGTVKTKKIMENMFNEETGEMESREIVIEIRTGIYKGLTEALGKLLGYEFDELTDIDSALKLWVSLAISKDLDKLESLKDIKSVHQYSGEGGEFTIGAKGDLEFSEHMRRIEEQRIALLVRKKELLEQIDRAGTELNVETRSSTRQSQLNKLFVANKGKDIDALAVVAILKSDKSASRSSEQHQRQLQILRAIEPFLKGVKVVYKDMENNEAEGITDRVRGFFEPKTNTIVIRANVIKSDDLALITHEMLHAALSSRITAIEDNGNKDSAEYKALKQLEDLRTQLLDNEVLPVNGNEFLALKAKVEKSGGVKAYDNAKEAIKNNKEYQQAVANKQSIKDSLEQANTQLAELNTKFTETQNKLESSKDNSLTLNRVSSERSALKDELRAEQAALQESLVSIAKEQITLRQQVKALHTSIKQANKEIEALIGKDKQIMQDVRTYHEMRNTLKDTVFVVQGGGKLSALKLVEMLEDVHEFISYGLTETTLQDIMQDVFEVPKGNRKPLSLRGAWKVFISAVGRILRMPNTKTLNALTAFSMDVADLLNAIGSVTPAVAPNNGERLFSTQSAEDQVNTKPEINTALEQARKAVRELLTQLNFKFVDSPDVNLSDIERIASKYLTEGESNNDPAFLKDAAISLSYAIYFELGLPQGNAKMREGLEQSLLDWLTTGEIPKLHKSVWVKVVEIFNKLMAAFSGKEFKAIESRLEATLNKIINREDFSFKPKQGYAKLVFQKEMTNNPLAVQSLLTFIKSGIKFALTGSVAYADQVPLYRQENKPLHDMDFLVAPEDLQDAYDYFTQKDPDNWGGSFTLYDVVKEGRRILGFAIVPKGFVIKNGKSEWNREQKAPERSYDVFNVVTGLKAGSYYFLGGKEEVFTGVAGITIDLLAEDARDTVTQTFKDTTGTNKSIEVSSYVGGFTAKLDMLRLKDITDFIGVVPPTERVLSKPKAVKPTEEPITKPAPAVNTIAQYQVEAAALEDDALDVALSGLLDKQRKGDKSPLLKMKFKAYNDEMNKRGAAVSNKGERRYSKNTKSGNGLTVASARQLLVKQFGEKLIKALEAKGLLRIVETMAETPEAALESNTEGYYLNGKATLVADGLTPETVVATLLHELSGHKGFQELMEPAAYNALMKQFDKLVAEGNPIALAALKRAQEATGSDGKPLSLQGQMDEYLPYLLTIQAAINATQAQKSAIAKFIDNVFRAVRAWAYKKLQANGYEGAASTFMQPQDIVYMAERMLREMASSSVTSGNTQSPIKFSTQSAEDLVNGQSSLDIMTALPHSNTGAFNQQLDRLIVGEIGQLYNQDDAAKARIDEIQTLTASDALNVGFTLSRKEQYVQQALQYAVAAYMKLHAGGANVGQLRRVYHAAKAKMDVAGKDFHEGDWATATQQEKDVAKAKYDFMFDSSQDSEFMSRFVSMALASESVSKILDIALPLTKPETQDKTWFETVNDWVSYVMAWLTNKYVRLNPTLGASNQLVQLMDNLVKLDIRNRQEGVALHQKAWNTIGLVTTPLNSALKGAGGAVLSGVGLRESRFLPVRALGAILVLRSEEAAKAIPKMIIDMRNNQNPNTKLGEVCNILLEASGVGTLLNKFDVLTRQANLNAKNRQDIVDNVKKAVNKWFKEPLTKVQSKAIAYGLLGTDAQALLENYSVEDIVDMALHEGKLNVEIAKLKKEIAKNPNGNDMLNAAEQLGYYMVTRIGGEGLVKNALGIAIGLGTQYFTSVEQADPKLVSQLNTLGSMLAMTHVPNSDKAILAALYKRDAEGVHAVIQLHQGLVNDSLKDFQANPLNMVKGWMPEVTNPYLEIKAANSMVERQQMEAEGWVLIDELKRDKHDKGSPKYLMKHNDIGYQRLVSGAVDLGSTARSGTEAISRTSPKYLGITQARYQNAARRAAIPNGSFDPSKQPRGLIAAYDTDGVALGYNYEMDNETRDAHLDRKHNIGDLLGTFGGLNYYKPEKAKQSNTVAEVLFEDYKANYSQNPNAYLKISHKSTDPKVVEMWRMLPQDFKQRATELYGKGNPIIIRNEAFNLAFGFKKFSVVSYAFDAVKAERERVKNGLVGTGKSPNAFQSGFVGFTERLRGNTAQADFAKAEHVVQEIVKAIKDFIVIRSGTTMMWNIFANVLMLMANGINPVTIIKDWVFAVTNVRAYQKLNSQLIQAQADLAGGKDPIALKQKIGALKAELKANVMNPYINAGLLSSIVDDVNIQHGEYTYTSAFKQTVDEKTQWIPKPVKTAAAIATIAPSTKLYQFLATTTQLSDFVAKYSMSKHLQANGTDIDASIIEASKTFINYDVPTSQGLQYANDMGLFMFTKFFLRIQAVLMKLLGKRAGSTIAQHILVESLTGAEGVLSPSLFNRIGNNPLESSVLGIPSAFFGIGTIDAVTDFGVSF